MTWQEMMKNEYGYEPITTFWDDFSIADVFGASAVKDTYKRAFNEWKTNYKYLTELVMVLNHKIWQHYQKNETLATLYDTLWREEDEGACANTNSHGLSNFYHTTH